MIDEKLFLGSWAHAHEEDDAERQTFRPASADLPPSRGRTEFTFLPGHRAVGGVPGPDDRGSEHGGTWTLRERPDGDVLEVVLPRARATYRVLAATRDRLLLQPITPT